MPIPVKLTRAHQVALPKRLLEKAGWTDQDFFLAELEGSRLVLSPLRMEEHAPPASFSDLKRHFTKIGITQKTVQEAIRWARQAKESVYRRRRTKR